MQLQTWRKDKIREQTRAILKQLDSYDRQAKSAVSDKILNEAKELSKTLEDGHKFLVHVFGAGANGKVLDSAIKQFKKPGAILALSLNDEIGKIVVVAKVDKVRLRSNPILQPFRPYFKMDLTLLLG